MFYPRLTGSVVCLCLAGAGWTQTPRMEAVQRNAMDRQQELLLKKFTTDQSAPELFTGESQDVGEQSILRLRTQKQWTEAQGDWQYGYLSNVYLQENGPGQQMVDTGLMIATLQAAFAPDFLKLAQRRIYPRLGFRHQRYQYGLEDHDANTAKNLNYLDFEVNDVFAEVRYDLADSWRVEAGMNAQWLTGHRLDGTRGTTYKEWLPQWSATKNYSLDDHRMFMVGYYGMYHVTSVPNAPQENLHDRLDNLLTVTYTHGIGEHLVVQPYYRFMVTTYTEWYNARTDLTHTFGGMVGWFFTPNVSVRFNVSYDIRESDDPMMADYRNLNGGVGLNFNFRY